MILVSGSWDATAKIWDLESGECIKTLEGHSHAVCVLILKNGKIVTGSQDGNLHIWTNSGEKINSKIKAHDDIIRNIIEIEGVGLLTCSNDAKIKLWGSETLEEFGVWNHHGSFIFALDSLGGTNFISGGEDFELKICKDGKIREQDTILLPNTIWNAKVDSPKYDQDIVIASGDG